MGYQNFYTSRLATDIGASDTTIALETPPVPTSGRLVLEARNTTKREIVKYTGVSGNQITGVTRGQGGTSATDHLKNSLVEMNLTAEDIADLFAAFAAFTGTYPLKNLYDNAIINAGCMVAQRSAPSISSTYQYGQVDRFAAKATGTAVSAGTIEQDTTPSVVTQGYSLKIAGLTVTGTGIAYVRYRMEAKDAIKFKSKSASFGVTVRHDVGSNINYTIYINKPTVADDFTSTTNVHTSSATSVGNNTNTQIKTENVSLGDVSNGIEIEVRVACGAVTTKNFEFGEFIFNEGATLSTFMPTSYESELAACQRYYLNIDGGNYNGIAPVFVGVNESRTRVPTPVQMRGTPTVSISALVTRYGGSDFTWGSSPTVDGVYPNGVALIGVTTGTLNGNSGTLCSASGYIRFNAEL